MIKKTLIAIFLLLGIHSFAQLNKNRVMVNGRGNFYTDKRERDANLNNVPLHNIEKVSEGNVNLNVGYFLSDNFAIGGTFGFGKKIDSRNETFNVGDHTVRDITTQNFSAGVFARYNHMIKESKFGLFFQLSHIYEVGKMDNISTQFYNNGTPYSTVNQEKTHGFKTGLTPGLMYYITNRCSIEGSIGDLSFNYKITKDTPLALDVRKESTFNADFSMATVYFGLTFYLGGKKSEDIKNSANEK
jgi:hypothetical protein